MRFITRAANIAIISIAILACGQAQGKPPAADYPDSRCNGRAFTCYEVSGTAIHYFSTAVIHSVTPTDTGIIQLSSDTIDLEGDLTGRVLYHPVTEIDFATNTLVNTGHQVFSGTVMGSQPVLIADDSFRFDVDLNTGATVGKVFLDIPLAGPKTRCLLTIVGTGMNENGDGLAEYAGRCRVRTGNVQSSSNPEFDELQPHED